MDLSTYYHVQIGIYKIHLVILSILFMKDNFTLGISSVASPLPNIIMHFAKTYTYTTKKIILALALLIKFTRLQWGHVMHC